MLRLRRHSRLRDQMSSYLDGQVTEAEGRQVEQHVTACEACRAELEELRATVALLSELPELAAPRSFALQSLPVIVAPPAPVLWGVWATRVASAAAAVFLVALLVGDAFGIVSQTRTTSDASTAALKVLVAPVAELEVIKEVVKEVPVEVEVEKAVMVQREKEVILEPEKVVAAPAQAAAAKQEAPVAEDKEAPAKPRQMPAIEEAQPAPEIAAVTAAAAPSLAPAPVSEPGEPSADVAAASELDQASIRAEVGVAEAELSPPGGQPVEPVSREAVEEVRRQVAATGLRVPLWQLEVGAGLGLILMVLAAIWAARRARGSPR